MELRGLTRGGDREDSRMPSIANRATLGRTSAREVEDRQRWWQIGLFVMLVALAGEAIIGRRAT